MEEKKVVDPVLITEIKQKVSPVYYESWLAGTKKKKKKIIILVMKLIIMLKKI